MERLWSPWRLAYVTGTSGSQQCIFCDALNRDDHDPLIVARGRHSFVILNLYPYNSGHLMVVPNRHVGTLAGLALDEATEMMQLTQSAETALNEVYQPQGINVGINLGRPAGAGVLDHVHVHLVPRWTGDTNFMSVVGNVRVLPEEVHQSAERLRPAFARLLADQTVQP
jgi:ATP adenylyltransferase